MELVERGDVAAEIFAVVESVVVAVVGLADIALFVKPFEGRRRGPMWDVEVIPDFGGLYPYSGLS